MHATMAESQADPESIGAGPLINPTASIGPQHRDRHSFLWSRVHLSHDSITPPPRSGAASVVVQGKVRNLVVVVISFFLKVYQIKL